MVHRIRTGDIPEVAHALTDVADYVPPPVMWCAASHGWVNAAPPHIPLDPALWRPSMADWLREVAAEVPHVWGLPEVPQDSRGSALSFDGYLRNGWRDLAESIRYLPGPVSRDLKEILSGEPAFRREPGMTPERWLSQCEQSAGGFTSRADLLATFRKACPDSAIGQRAFFTLAREVLGRDGRFGPKGAKGPWGFRVTLPR